MSYLDDTKITPQEKQDNWVQSASDRLTGSALQNKQVFDKLPVLIVERHNSLVEEIQTKQTIIDNAIADLQGREEIYVDTTAGWDAQPSLISEDKAVYVYTDHVNEGGIDYPGFKVGDGLAYVIDLPFNDDLFISHIADTDIHITDSERTFWNNKVSAFIDVEDEEALVLSTT